MFLQVTKCLGMRFKLVIDEFVTLGFAGESLGISNKHLRSYEPSWTCWCAAIVPHDAIRHEAVSPPSKIVRTVVADPSILFS